MWKSESRLKILRWPWSSARATRVASARSMGRSAYLSINAADRSTAAGESSARSRRPVCTSFQSRQDLSSLRQHGLGRFLTVRPARFGIAVAFWRAQPGNHRTARCFCGSRLGSADVDNRSVGAFARTRCLRLVVITIGTGDADPVTSEPRLSVIGESKKRFE
jgi:hypothetical protein